MKLLNKKSVRITLLISIIVGLIFGLLLNNIFSDLNIFYIFISLFLLLYFLVILNKLIYKHLYKGAPNVSTPKNNIEIIKIHIQNNHLDNIADLGSGVGNLCLELTDKKRKITGYELNPIPYLISKLKIFTKKKNELININYANFWKMDLSQFDCVIIYGISYIMADLEKKLRRELKPGTHVISNYFQFDNLEAVKKENDVYFYIIN